MADIKLTRVRCLALLTVSRMAAEAEQMVLFTNLNHGRRASTTVLRTYSADCSRSFRHVRPTTFSQTSAMVQTRTQTGTRLDLVGRGGMRVQVTKGKDKLPATVHTCCCCCCCLLRRQSQLVHSDQSEPDHSCGIQDTHVV